MTYQTHLAGKLARGETVLIDGGTGTEIERLGGAALNGLWSGAMALDHSDLIADVHRSYIHAGAEVIIANTYASSRHLLEGAGFGDKFELLNRRGVEVAIKARHDAGAADVVIAGSMSTTEMGGERVSLATARTNYRDQAAILADAGAEMIILEMMRDIDETAAMLDGVEATGLPIWLGFSTPAGHPELLKRETNSLADGVRSLEGRPIDVLSIMHSEVPDIDMSLDIVFEHWTGPVGVYAHVGDFVDFAWIPDDSFTPAIHTSHNQRWIERGVQVIGGCCGIGPDHIKHLRQALFS